VKGKILIAIQFLIIAGLLSYFFYFKGRNGQESRLTLYGNVDIRQVDLGFRVFGRVDTLYFDEGDLVKPGDLLATLDKGPYLEAVAIAKANVQAAKANLINADLKFHRREEVAQEAISKEDLDNAFFEKETLKAQMEAAEANLASKVLDYEDTNLFAPSCGSILTRIREPGSVVNTGEPIFTLSITAPVWVRAYVSEPDLGKIYPGMEAEVYTDTPSSPVYKGTIGFISPVAEFTPKNVETVDLRTDLVYRLRVIIQDPGKGLRQGMPVTVKLDLKEPKK
jgi:HlyD family secretion protein